MVEVEKVDLDARAEGLGVFSIDPNPKSTHPAHGNVEIELFDRPCPGVNGHAPE